MRIFTCRKSNKIISCKELNILLIIIWIITLTISSNGQDRIGTNQSNNEIRGYVLDAKTGEPLVFANVIIKGTRLGAATNKRGFFVIFNAPSGKLTLLTSYIGYESKETEIVNKSGGKEELYIKLKPQDISTEEINVVADQYKYWKTADEISQVTVSPTTLSGLPNLGEKDIFRSLQLLPGVSSINDGSAGLYIRGGTPDENLVLLDGITIYHVDHFFGFFSAFNSDAIKDVQLYKGGFGSEFGGRISSVVDLTMKTGDMNKFRMSLGANLLSANSVVEIPVFGKGSILISARRSYADIINSGFYDKIYSFLTGGQSTASNTSQSFPGGPGGFGQQETNTTPSFYYYDLNTKLSYNLSNKDFISISFYSGKDYLDQSQNSQQVTLRNNFSSASRSISDITNWGNLGESLKWTRQWSDRWYSDFTLSHSNYFSKYINSNQFDQNIQDTSGAIFNGSTGTKENNQVYDFTIKYNNDYLLSQRHKLGFGVLYSDISTSYKFNINDTLSILDRSQNGYNVSSYLQDKWNIIDPVDITLGIRETYFNPTRKFYTEPRFSLQYKLSDLIKLKAAWGKYYQFINQITREDILQGSRDFWLISSPDLEPLSAVHYILGTEFETNDYLFSIEGYYKKLDNLLQYSQRIVRNQQGRLLDPNNYLTNFFRGNGTAKGIEFLLQKKFGQFNGWISYTLGKVDYVFPDFNNGASFPADQDKTNEVKIIGSYETGNWNFSASWIYSTGTPYTAPESQYFITLLDGETQSYIHVSEKNEFRLPDYHRLDVSASYKFKNDSFSGEFGLSVFNLYNRKNIWYKKYDLTVYPAEVTNVNMLGMTPTIFVKFNF